MERKSYRYPGVQPFTARDSDVFFGRDEEIKRLYKLITLENIVVLFGKSGYGKSSLINAGIIPLINQKKAGRSPYHAIEVRIGKVSGQSVSPVQKIISKLDEQFKDLEKWSFLDKYNKLPVLWNNFKRKQSDEARQFILIFDQFEEFFTYSAQEQEDFRWALAELMTASLPREIQESIDEISPEEYNNLANPLSIKVLFSIRSDRLSLLHSMKDAFPNILGNRFEIKALGMEQAKEAIILPALKKDPKFVTHPFSYDDVSLNIILDELKKMQSSDIDSIETFHLQIICQACEAKIEEKLKNNIVDEEINPEDLPEFKNLYVEYYKRQIEKLPPPLREPTQKILENELIFDDPSTGDQQRLSVDGNVLKREFSKLGIQEDVLNTLENTFLIRREPNTVGGFSYEIAHETIMEPILRIKYQRKQVEEQALREQSIRQQTLRDSAAKRRKLAIKVFVIAMTLFLLFWNWKPLYFRYLVIKDDDGTRPIIRLDDKLNEVKDSLFQSLQNSLAKIGHSPSLGPWTASQMVAGVQGQVHDSVNRNFINLTQRSITTDSLCGWVEMRNLNDFRASGWVASTIGILGKTKEFPCNILRFFLDNQLSDGSWSMFKMNKNELRFGSTYATCHVIRALHNSLRNVGEGREKQEIAAAILRGKRWLLTHAHEKNQAVWDDYPADKGFENLLSLSLSGLVIHTLDLIDSSAESLNRQWINGLNNAQASLEINHIERSDMLYNTNEQGAEFRDLTRHLVLPWQIIATIDAYRYGTTSQKIKANMWLDNFLENLDTKAVLKNPDYVKSEIYIALRYLADTNYQFK